MNRDAMLQFLKIQKLNRRKAIDDEFVVRQAKVKLENATLLESQLDRQHQTYRTWSDPWWASVRRLGEARTARIEAERDIRERVKVHEA